MSSVVYSFCSENCLSKILIFYINIKSLSFLITIICNYLISIETVSAFSPSLYMVL